MTQIAIQDDTFTRLAHAAETQNVSASDLAEQIIREHLQSTVRQRMAQEIESYRVLHPTLKASYLGMYVAIYQGQVIDQDSDLATLALRMDEHYSDEPVLITQVKPEVDETLFFRSPSVSPL